jgi:hypothetical protein
MVVGYKQVAPPALPARDKVFPRLPDVQMPSPRAESPEDHSKAAADAALGNPPTTAHGRTG